MKALSELEYTVNSSARRYNELKVMADKKAEQLKQLQVQDSEAGAGRGGGGAVVIVASFGQA